RGARSSRRSRGQTAGTTACRRRQEDAGRRRGSRRERTRRPAVRRSGGWGAPFRAEPRAGSIAGKACGSISFGYSFGHGMGALGGERFHTPGKWRHAARTECLIVFSIGGGAVYHEFYRPARMPAEGRQPAKKSEREEAEQRSDRA